MLEICCGSFEDALAAYKGGARRIELNCALALGGLTPSTASLKLVKESCPELEVVCMVRPRAAGFCYTETQISQIFAEANELLEAGADGLAFGFLHSDGTINLGLTDRMQKLCAAYGADAVFHRAFDCVKDPYKACEQLIELGIVRILTSGLKAKAWEGRELLKKLQELYGERIELLAGSGINVSNAVELMSYTGVKQVHSSCKDWAPDPTTAGQDVSYSFADGIHKCDYDVVSEDLVRGLVALGIA